MDNNLTALLTGKTKSVEEKSEQQLSGEQSPPTPAPINTTHTVKSNTIVQPVQVLSSEDKRSHFSVYLKSSLLLRFKQAVTADGQKMSTLIVTWIQEYLRQREQYEN